MEQFDAFCEAVCRQVRHATPKELRAIRAELTGHLEDRAEVLLSRGLEEAQAESAAVAAMGDPEAIGRELNRQYPLGWLLLSRTLLVLLAAAVSCLFRYLLPAVSGGFAVIVSALAASVAGALLCPVSEEAAA